MNTPTQLMTEEGITRSKNAFRRYRRYIIAAALAAIVIGYGFNRYYTRPHLNALQRVYLPQYEWTIPQSFLPPFFQSDYSTLIAAPNDIRDLNMPAYTSDEDIEPDFDDEDRVKLDNRGRPIFLLKHPSRTIRPAWAIWKSSANERYEWLRHNIYGEKSLLEIWEPAIVFAIFSFVAITGLCILLDTIKNRRYLKGKAIRGTTLIKVNEYVKLHRDDTGYSLPAFSPDVRVWVLKLRRLVGLSFIPSLTVPRKAEAEGLLLLGDPGTGKTQVIHKVLLELRRRNPSEPIICYDPEAEFLKAHCNKDDIILNPLDRRCTYWSPCLEVNYDNAVMCAADCKLIAECFFPYRRHTGTNSDFFIDAARTIFARILQFERSLERICEILANAELIDEIVAGTEHAHLIDPGARAQRAGVLATLSEIGESLRLLPPRETCRNEISLTEYAKQRKGSIFITARHDQRDALGRLDAIWINLLMKRVLASDLEWSTEHPCWLVIDEVHALKHLSALPTVIVEGRKHNLKLVVGTQNKAQLEEHYGPAAATMLASFHTKIFFRCNEPESARWVSALIGDAETEKPRMSTTASVQRYGRDSIGYTNMAEVRPVVSKEEIMSLRNRYGYWKYENVVVQFFITPVSFTGGNERFVERYSQAERRKALMEFYPAQTNGKDANELAIESLGELDRSF